MAKQPPRKVIHSTPNPKGDGWITQLEGRTLKKHGTQKEAEADGGLGQAVLHKDRRHHRGERTYGSDPERSTG